MIVRETMMLRGAREGGEEESGIDKVENEEAKRPANLRGGQGRSAAKAGGCAGVRSSVRTNRWMKSNIQQVVAS